MNREPQTDLDYDFFDHSGRRWVFKADRHLIAEYGDKRISYSRYGYEEFRYDTDWLGPTPCDNDLVAWVQGREHMFEEIPTSWTQVTASSVVEKVRAVERMLRDKAIHSFTLHKIGYENIYFERKGFLGTNPHTWTLDLNGILLSPWKEITLRDEVYLRLMNGWIPENLNPYPDIDTLVEAITTFGARRVPVWAETKEYEEGRETRGVAEDWVFYPDLRLRDGIPLTFYKWTGPYFGQKAKDFERDFASLVNHLENPEYTDLIYNGIHGSVFKTAFWVMFYMRKNGNTPEKISEAMKVIRDTASLEDYLQASHYSKRDSSLYSHYNRKAECVLHSGVIRFHDQAICAMTMHWTVRMRCLHRAGICRANIHYQVHDSHVELADCDEHQCGIVHSAPCRSNPPRCIYCDGKHFPIWCKELARRMGLVGWKYHEFERFISEDSITYR